MSSSLSSTDGSAVSVNPHDIHSLVQDAWYWRELDRSKARTLITEILESYEDVTLRSRAQIVQAYIAWREGHLAEALEYVQSATSVIREEHDLTWLARALNAFLY
jgi:hypothetical protein